VAASAGPDQGSTFEIWLPLAAPSVEALAAEAPDRVSEPEAERRLLADLKVLVVDDDPTALELLPRLLGRAGAQVHTANSAEAGLAALLAFHPDVLVSDVEMPGTDGFAFLRRVRALADEEGGAVPAAALTAYVREEERRRILLAGFQAHLGKPINADELVRTVAHLAGRAAAPAVDPEGPDAWTSPGRPPRRGSEEDLLN
jgi:CheY-like chemotaxis protein